MRRVKHSKPTVSIFADASIKRDLAGWGGWARGDGRGPIFLKGPATAHKSSTVVELEALAKTTASLFNRGYLSGEDVSVLLQSDSLHGLEVLNFVLQNAWATKKSSGVKIERSRPPKPDEAPWANHICNMLEHCEVVYLRHVKGHRGGDTSRSWVNEQCDRLAKEAVQEQELK